MLSRYHLDKAFPFPEKFHFLVKTITDSVRLGVVYLNLVLSTANGFIFVKFIYRLRPTMTSPRSTIYLKFIYFEFFKPILDPSFPVNLEVLLIKIVLFFDH